MRSGLAITYSKRTEIDLRRSEQPKDVERQAGNLQASTSPTMADRCLLHLHECNFAGITRKLGREIFSQNARSAETNQGERTYLTLSGTKPTSCYQRVLRTKWMPSQKSSLPPKTRVPCLTIARRLNSLTISGFAKSRRFSPRV